MSKAAEFFEELKIQINLFRNNGSYIDCSVICKDSGFCAHKIILCAASEYFENYFKSQNTVSVDIEFMESQTFQTILDFIYGVPDLSNVGMADLMDAFEKLKMSFYGIKDLHDISHDLNRKKNKGNEQIEWMLQKIKVMQQTGFLLDCRLTCGNKQFFVHHVIPAAFSGYFRKEFDKSSDLLLPVNLINSKTLENTLIFFYEGRLDVTLDNDLIDLMEASIVLEIPLLYNASLKELLASISPSSQSTVFDVLNTDLIKRTYSTYLSWTAESSEIRQSFVRLLKIFIFIFRCSAMFSHLYEVLVFIVLLWADENYHNISDLNYLLESIDFSKIKNSYFQIILNRIKVIVTTQFYEEVASAFHEHLASQSNSEPPEINESYDNDKDVLESEETNNFSIESLKIYLEEYIKTQ